ncbi:type II secretion system F family protein [Candidatus Parcubacteria bacterium]|nr:type II secretion system F family protein [Patescibacteria group bacterium]MBU4309923.1 type II secretion system F family protein [Patescibacteria group bacterium]MBU4432074.1 type II secretion system F family protein [Patescibacteria group bacterium]MBU4577848.1 type II secretion system F family protein [Patescibacteria group bacterium]MCG2696909.1 type II secretion system F family protein [Candidatus Parcubacteria bacterium]
MPNFKYKGVNSHGQVVNGLVEAVDSQMANKSLANNGIDVFFLREKKGIQLLFNLSFLSGVTTKEVVIFIRQFSVLISASVTLSDALQLLAAQTEGKTLKKVISEIAGNVEGGMRLSDAFEKHATVFSKFFINVVRSGETSGKLDEVLNYLADELEKDYDMLSKIKGAMIYPAFVFFGLLVVGGIMMVFVVPKLVNMMLETGGELPASTRALITISDFFVHFWPLMIISIIGLVMLFRYLKKTKKGKKIIDSMSLKVPIFGNLMNKIYLVRFSRSLRTLIVGGSTITSGLKVAAGVIDNSVYQDLINQTIKEVEDGNSISGVFMANSHIIPGMVPQMMMVGEKTGRLDFTLEKIVDFYTREINNIVANLMTLMEPIIMVVMGIGVGVMVAAIVMPMYQMSSNM